MLICGRMQMSMQNAEGLSGEQIRSFLKGCETIRVRAMSLLEAPSLVATAPML